MAMAQAKVAVSGRNQWILNHFCGLKKIAQQNVPLLKWNVIQGRELSL